MIRETTEAIEKRLPRPLPLPPQACKPLRREGIISVLLCHSEGKKAINREADLPGKCALFIIQEGTMRLTLADGVYTASAGQSILLSEGVARRWELIRGKTFRAIRVRIRLEEIEKHHEINLPVIATSTELGPLTLLAEACYQEATRPAPRPEALFHYAAALACHFRRELANLSEGSNPNDLRKLEGLWEDVRKDLARNWSVQDFADIMHVSRTRVFEWVQEHYGVSPVAYLTSLRISRACHRLITSNVTLETLSSELGYSSPYALSNSFKRVMDVRPSEWRRREASSL